MILTSKRESPLFTVSWATDTPHKERARVPVALVDFDANVDFLPKLTEAANAAQAYYDFDVLYLPFPSGVVRPAPYQVTGTEVSCFYLPELEGYLDKAPESLNVKVVCCLTSGLLPDGEEDDLFVLPLATNSDVFAISTYGLRNYAEQARTSFAKAALFLWIGGSSASIRDGPSSTTIEKQLDALSTIAITAKMSSRASRRWSSAKKSAATKSRTRTCSKQSTHCWP